MFSWRAEMIAARSRAFMEGSGWPILAATAISRASFENSFDFWASCRPLRCMMFLNWECPAMRSLSGFVRDVIGWKARRYRPRPRQNQRFAGDFGISVVRAGSRRRARLAVVASEVKALAVQTQNATKEITKDRRAARRR